MSPVFLIAGLTLLVVGLLMLTEGLTDNRKVGYHRVRRHQRYQDTAGRVLARLKTLGGDGQRLIYLRKINPYVLEELLLTAFEQQGHEVVRNPSYSGDGGLDGQVVIDGRTWLIQAKRYRRSISPQHVAAFIRLLESRNQPGFFIHTGRTGPKSRELNRDCALIYIVSGQQLLDLLAGLPLKENTVCMTH
jgi:restriction system protein